MLHLILGTAGTGKTALLYEQIQDCVKADGKAILLVPEQSSFESEKALYRKLGPKDALSVEVLSFTRLCDRIFREYGGLAGVHMDDTAKYLLMSVTLGELGMGGGLRIYNKSSGNAAFVSTICETIGELKSAGATPETLRGAAAESTDKALSEKLKEIALIFEAYQAVIDRGYNDPDDSLPRACKALENEHFFHNYHVFVDGFMAFMGAEWKLLRYILTDSPHATVTLTCTGLDSGDKTGVLAAVTATARRLVEEAKRCGSRVAKPVVLGHAYRYQNPALAYLASEYPKEQPCLCDSPTQGVTAVVCEDVYDELEYIGGQIALLVQEQGCRYRDIAVIGRDLGRYLVPLQTVFSRYEIPFFTDLRADIQVYPFVNGLLCALDAVRSNFDSDYMLSLAKQCITGLSEMEAGMLENYCFVWSVKGKDWTSDFVNHPDGMEQTLSEEDAVRLADLNAVRKKLMAPLLRMKKRLADCDGREFAAAVFQYLTDCGAVENLTNSAREMPEDVQKQFLDTGAQVWDVIMNLLDVFGGALGGVHMPLSRLIDLFRMSIATADIGTLPQTLDQVIVGTADRIRPNAPKAVFVIGLNEGEFPRWSVPSGIFSASERNLLGKHGIDLLQTPERTALFEQYFAYFAITQASEKLWLTCPLKDTAGNGLTPSGMFRQVEELLGCKMTSSTDDLDRICNEKTAFDVMTRHWRERTPRQQALKHLFASISPQRLQALEHFCDTKEFYLSGQDTAKRLFGSEIRISPSRVERFYNCPFSYFCQSGLQLNPRRRAEFNPIESGSLIHLVLEQMVKKYGGGGLASLDQQAMRQEISRIIRGYLTERIADLDGMPARFQYLFQRLVNTLVRLLERLGEEFAQSEFQPAAFELPIRADAQNKPLELYAPDGSRILVEGIVDRVDLLKKNGTQYIRVVDYKSGAKEFRLSDVYYGLNMQMLIYLFALCENSSGNGQESIPAGVLYMPARDKVLSAERQTDEKTARDAQGKQIKMSGILLENREVLTAMEAGLAGIFIPVKTKKDGSYDANSSLANLSQMGQIKERVESLLCGIAEQLHSGKIAAVPVDGVSRYAPCSWCDYHAICAHEDGDAVRKITELDKAAALELIGKGETDG